MRTRMLRPTPWLVLLLGATACGEVAATPAAKSTDGPDAATYVLPPSTLSPLSYGRAYALETNTITVNGQVGYEVGAEFTAATMPSDPCANATKRSGACCFIPAPATIDAGAPTGPAGQNPDGGFSSVAESAGTLSFANTTSRSPLATSSYGQIPTGFGSALGYAIDLINPTTWNDGDVLSITAAGAPGQVTAFSGAIHAVKMPDATLSSTIARGSALAFTWTPDSNASTMTVTLTAAANNSAHGSVSCQVDDQSGALTIDSSLLQDFQAGDSCWTDVEREGDQHVELTGGHVTFASRALNQVIATIQ